ncbi:MAG: hypothetical protein JJT96_08330 [Opitutales bacterium]|nr:hypothetical protein [Opitutales bacterium]
MTLGAEKQGECQFCAKAMSAGDLGCMKVSILLTYERMLSREIIRRALIRLGEKANANGIHLDICVYGGSAMLLAYDNRAMSRDVDVTIHPTKKGLQLAQEVGEDMGLHLGWFNDDVKAYIADKREGKRTLADLDEIPGVKIQVATAAYLLAMKALACREPFPGQNVDAADLRFLVRKMGIRTLAEVEECVDRFYDDRILSKENQAAVSRIIEEVENERRKGMGEASGNAGGSSESNGGSEGVRP